MTYILVIGGAGYIGSHTCKVLAASGYTPVVFDNLVYGHADAVRWGPFEQGDLSDPARLDEVMQNYDFACVIHFAAFAYVGESVTDPGKYYSNNIQGSLNLLEAMRRNGLDKIVFSSTCATYGEPAQLPIVEDMPQAPVNPYGFTKLVIEQALKDYSAAYGMTHIAFRYFNAAGCDPEGDLGERHDPETHVIPLAINAALGRGEFKLFGTDYDTPDGTAIRDYVHVNDLADAHKRGVDYLLEGGQSEAINLATGVGVSVKELVAAVEAATGRKVPVQYAPRRAGDPPALCADPSKAKNILGWEAQYRDITEIVRTASDWLKKQNSV
jgi:UDP-glucose-4-epimerase GalE